jgi:seryl-tRNA synthetase
VHDIRDVREDPRAFDAGLARRGHGPEADRLIAIDVERRDGETALQTLRGRRNAASKEIGEAMRAGDAVRAEALKREVADGKDRMAELEAIVADAAARLHDALAAIPNLPAPEVPEGLDEGANVLVLTHGRPRTFGFTPLQHDVLGAPLGIDAPAGAAIAGARFVVLRGGVARLARALGQFMLDRLVDGHGYEEIAPPLLVRTEAAFGTGQLPKFADDLFRTTDGRWLIPTAEVPLTNLVRERIIAEDEVPLRFAALTPCFRQEAGSAGRDTRGLIRQHQFDKVEMVSVVSPDDADEELERTVTGAEGVLEALDLPYRRMALCAGDMGFSARRTIDLEVWLPGQDAWREISSCSDCGPFQARRMDARIRTGDGMVRPHTLNGSGLAVGRTLVAVLENHQTAEGGVMIPAALRPYMGGMEVLARQAD